MTESLLSEKQNKLLDQVAKKHGLENYQIIVHNDPDADEGHLSRVQFITLHNINDNTEFKIVLKVAPTSEDIRKRFYSKQCFLREIHVYQDLFSEFVKLQNAYNIPNPFNAIPKVYGTISDELHELIILENLKSSGYKLYNRLEPLTGEHLSLIIIEFARLHAVSFAMKYLDFEKFNQLVDPIRSVTFDNPDQTESERSAFEAAVYKKPLETLQDNPVAAETLKKCLSIGLPFFYYKPKTNEDVVVVHGDCWCMNMLYKYEDKDHPTSPTQARIIDWQFSRLFSPIFDLSYFLCISAGKQDLNNYLHYLHLYHKTLSDNLSAFGLDSNKIYSYEKLEADWKKYFAVGLSSAAFMLAQTLTKKGNPETGDNADQDADRYKRRLTDIIDFIINNNFV